jgi:hypothetical protein
MSAIENTAVFLNHLVVALLFYTLIAFTMDSTVVSSRYLRAKFYIGRTASVVLGVLGFGLLKDR